MSNFINKLDNYQVLPRELIFDNKLSDRARFVFCFMASKPNDWDFYLEPMAKEIGYSVETLRKYINELVKSGWLTKGEQERKEGNRYGAVIYTLNEKVQTPENSDTENFSDGKNTTQHSIYYNRIDSNEQKVNNKKGFDLSFIDERFMEAMESWLSYKKEIKDSYKSERSIKACYNNLIKLSWNNPTKAMEIVNQSIANNWKGLFELKEKVAQKRKSNFADFDNKNAVYEEF